ncbi:right-handed parallel beta-helix repeat-containing protein [Myroides sp. WP-1]|uniref:right-handed parallel beta-helix repeat-containing protein n=1 Tax=Myroides sp. WP-1 TaxID=2759944 RepID=UPI0015FE3324|nr:right-handed parallel beta-helix repeat-containing protein [Myroides sp. WP-1]MBB1140542.1 right-handed parallel beta-helix repeat-containing protein [Myroides sp. WP-1]
MRILFNLLFFTLCFQCFATEDLSVLVERLKLKADFVILSQSDFIHALENSKENDVLYIKGEVEIDLTGVEDIELKEGVKLIGDRSKNKQLGALLYTKSDGVFPLFKVEGDDVLIAGLRIKGNDGKILKGKDHLKNKSRRKIKKNYLEYYNKNMYDPPVSIGIYTSERNTIIFNCELSQWTHAAIYLQKGATNIKVLNNDIFDNQRFGLGYGVAVNGGDVEIDGNFFKSNRHAVASNGVKGSSYFVSNNTFEVSKGNHWAVDVHGGVDRKDGTQIAGTYFVVENNLFIINEKTPAVVVRGVPEKLFLISNNRVIYTLENKDQKLIGYFFEQRNARGNFKVENNNVLVKEI